MTTLEPAGRRLTASHPAGRVAVDRHLPDAPVRAVLQRVSSASVTVDGQEVGAIARGLLVLLGVEHGDGPD